MENHGCFEFKKRPSISAFAAIVGKKEHEGPLGKYFESYENDAYFGQKTWEKAESELQRRTAAAVLDKGGLGANEIDFMLAGDLINQCAGSTFGLRGFHIPFFGIYGACSTMAEGLLLGSMLSQFMEGGNILALTSSHFCSAERQFRFPLSYGGQRTPTAQWTCTAAGAAILSAQNAPPYVRGGTVGRIVDYSVKDANNMGAAMAPAAADTIIRYLTATGSYPHDYDFIVTGDLGIIGSELLCEIMTGEGYDISSVHRDCGAMIFDRERQDTHGGGSGCGCSASVLCAYFLPRLRSGEIKNILFAATGALMSPTTSQQGESIPSISHLVHISHEKGAIV